MKNGYTIHNFLDGDGKPAGGIAFGTGFSIFFQSGPLGQGKDRLAPNGAFVEDILDVVRARIEHYQEVNGGAFDCIENARALRHIEDALIALENRTHRRVEQGTEGTHRGH